MPRHRSMVGRTSLEVWHWNVRSLYARHSELEAHLASLSSNHQQMPAVICLCESRVTEADLAAVEHTATARPHLRLHGYHGMHFPCAYTSSARPCGGISFF